MPIVQSSCPLDCPDACSLDVTVENGRVRAVGGNRVNPVTDGYICAKVRRIPEHLYGPDRLVSPGVRVGKKGEGRFRAVSWDEALETIARRFLEVRAEFGGEAILPYYYGGSNGYLTQESADARFFSRLGASRLLRTVCAAPTGAAALGLYGKMPGIAIDDYVHARLIVLWGVNPSATGIHIIPKIYEAQRRGAKIVVVDPRTTPLARRADLHLALRPGTDLAVALAVHRWLFESGRADSGFLERHSTGAERLREKAEAWTFERAADAAGVPAHDLERFARLYADGSPAALRCGWGLERNRNGGSAVAAVLALPAVAGKFGVRGGGYTLSNSASWKFDAARAAGVTDWSTRPINMNQLGEALLRIEDPPIKALFVYNSNALATSPRQEKIRAGLLREDLFTVVYDSVKTDTSKYADVVLPATNFLEHRELSRGYGAYILQDSPAAVPAHGEARPNYEVFAELCRRTGLARDGEAEDPSALVESIVSQSARAPEIRASLSRTRTAVPDCGPHPVQFVDVFPNTADGKIRLFPDELDSEAPMGLYTLRDGGEDQRFPLALISPASEKMISSTFGELDDEIARLEIHPEDAGKRSIPDGGNVRVFNEWAELRCGARVTRDVRPGVVRLPKGLWAKHTLNGVTTNALAPDSLTDLGGGACFNDARVEVLPLAP